MATPQKVYIPKPGGWTIPAWNDARLVEVDLPAAGQSRWKLIDARLVPNPGDHTIYVEAINRDFERDTEARVVFLNADGTKIVKTAEKPLDEPMCNVPIFTNSPTAHDEYTVYVDGVGLSDQVTGLHCAYQDHPEDGTTYGHASYLLQFQEMVGEEGTPEPDETLEQFVQRKSWDALNINYYKDAAFSKYAKSNNLGKPETNEFDVLYKGVTYRVQAFADGIIFCEVGKWDQIRKVQW